MKVKTIDTTGAGDAFVGGFLYKVFIAGKGLPDLTREKALAALEFANKFAAFSTTREGAVISFPTLAEINAFKGESVQ